MSVTLKENSEQETEVWEPRPAGDVRAGGMDGMARNTHRPG